MIVLPGPLPSEINNNLNNNNIRFENSVPSTTAPDRRAPWLQTLLQKEVQPVSTSPVEVVMSYSPTIFETHSTQVNEQTVASLQNKAIKPYPIYETSTFFTPTTLPPVTMTTDEIFSHYKQPLEPLSGPMYLIIQGHSKVKTYGQQNENITARHAPKLVPIVATKDPVITHVVNKDDTGIAMNIPHVFEKNTIEKENKTSSSAMDSLLSLLDTSFSGFFLGDRNGSEKVKTEKSEKLNSNKKASKENGKKGKDSNKKSSKISGLERSANETSILHNS